MFIDKIKIVLSCREASRRMAEGEFDDASLIVKGFIALHLLYCRYCRRYRRELKLMARAARVWAGRLVDLKRQEALERRLISSLL